MNNEGFATTQQREASDEIRDNLMYYSEDVLLTKFPHFADGCKNLIRRILWFTRDIKDLRPMNKVVGDLQEVHTSGDGSIADAVLRLGQPFTVGHPLVYIEGKYGEYYDVDAAAATRYLEAKSSEFTQDVYFQGVNTAAFQMMPTKNNRSLEPKYLIPKLPMALVLGNVTVGIAFTSRVQMIDITDVCKLVMAYAKYYQEGGITVPPNKLIAKYLLPSFPIKNIVLNRKELLEHYAAGDYNHPIKLEGWVDISGNAITLRSLPYGVNFGKTMGMFRERFKDPKDWIRDLLDSANDYSSDDTEFTINLKHGKNPFEVLDRLRSNLKIDTSFYPYYNYVRKEKIEELSPPVLTYYWYQERAANIATGLKYRQAQLIERRMRDQAILLVIDEADEVIKLIRGSENDEEATKAIYKRFNKLTLKQAGIVTKQPVSVWTKGSRKNLEDELEQIAADLETVHANFNRIDETIYNETTVLLRKYKSTSDTTYADDFIGYVKFGDLGIVNFYNYDHMKEILLTKGWPTNLVKTVHLYDPRLPRRFILRNGRLIEQKEMTKEVWCSQMFCYPLSERNELTLVVSEDKSTCVVEKIVQTVESDKFKLFPITKQFYALHRDGSITSEAYTNFSIRKSICKGAKTDVICGLPATMEDVALFYMNTTDPNVLRISRILKPGQENKLKFVPTGDVHILGVYPLKTRELIINIPKQCLRNFRLNHILINNLERLFDDGKDNHFFNLCRVKSELGKICKQDKQVSSFYHIDFGGIGQKQDD